MTVPHVVTLVGGYASMAANFETHLAEWGVEVVQHVEYLPLKIPSKTTLMIVLKSACSHSLSAAAQLVATKRSIPLVIVDHHWTQAEAILRRSGVLDPTSPAPPDVSGEEWRGEFQDLKREMTRLSSDLEQAEELILEQREMLERLQQQVATQQAQWSQTMGDPRLSMTIRQLRLYATHEVGLVGASKVPGGKMALLQRIQEHGSTGPPSP
jgi:hypothetical protein